MRTLTHRLALLGVCLCGLLLPATASATSSKAEIEASVSKGVTYLEGLQETSGGFPSDWDINSLAAAHVAAANIKKAGAETDVRTWYRKLLSNETATKWPKETLVTEYERAALVAYAAGIDPARVSKTQNLIAGIASYYQPESPGYYGPPGNFNGTVFAVLALVDAKTTGGVQRVPNVLLKKSVEVIEKNQHTDGGWAWEKAEGNETKLKAAAEPDMTGAAIAALCNAHVEKSSTVVKKAVTYLKGLLVSSSGAFESEFGANTDSNAWAVQGLDACGIEPQGTEFTASGTKKTPIDFLISQQLASGAFRYLTTGSTANEYSSQDAVRSLAGAGFTVTPPVPSEGLEQWFAASGFSTEAVKSPVTLIINNESTALKVCSVTFAPKETVTTLEKVLLAAEAESTSAGCVSGHSSEAGAISQINGYPAPAKALWDYSIDGGAEKQATLTSEIHLGDTIYLRFT
ncbi:MAG: prenyltransferase/squalene oxidase repeat-containing protein [Solirubrobacteraceae bacterium]